MEDHEVERTGTDPVAEFYRRHHQGETGFRRYGFTTGADERARWFKQYIGTGKNLLDIGCRDGTMTRLFLSGNKVTGVDVDPDALQRAQRDLGITVAQVNLNNERLPMPDCGFDVIVAGEILEHLQFPELVVAEIFRVLKPGGVFVGSVPNAFRAYNRALFLLGRDFENDPTHLHHFSPKGILGLLAGFKTVELDYIGSRHLWLSRRLMGTQMVWAARK